MTSTPGRQKRRISDHVHPAVYAVVAGLVVWFVGGVWIVFGAEQYLGITLVVVTGFFLMAMAIPFLLWRQWRKYGPPAEQEPPQSFHDWAAGEFEIARERRPALGAAIEIALPLAAAALGMTAIGIIFHFVAAGQT